MKSSHHSKNSGLRTVLLIMKNKKATGETCFYQVRTPQIQLWRITQIWIKTLPLKFLIGDLALERNLVGFLPAQMDNYFISTCKSRFNTTLSKLKRIKFFKVKTRVSSIFGFQVEHSK